jgi:DivIVA domain-containing protein
MELTVDTLRDAQFRQAWKGYDTAEVDDFLDELSTGVAELQGQLSSALERAELAEDRAMASESLRVPRSEPDEAVRRTLVLAQRAADLVVSEAKSVADRIVADAREQAAGLMATAQHDSQRIEQDAATKAAALINESEATASRLTAQRAAELQSELSGLSEEQGRKRLELDQLRQHVEATRAQLRGELEAQMRRLEALSGPLGPVPVSVPAGLSVDSQP